MLIVIILFWLIVHKWFIFCSLYIICTYWKWPCGWKPPKSKQKQKCYFNSNMCFITSLFNAVILSMSYFDSVYQRGRKLLYTHGHDPPFESKIFTTWWKDFSEILDHVEMITSHICCRFVRTNIHVNLLFYCISMMTLSTLWIYRDGNVH